MGWKTFKDRLALLVLLVIPAIWIVDARGLIALAEAYGGATIMAWGLVLQYYFRKKNAVE
tara:strand:+ start:30 stop:209 length:180 start_codon:yes stop_codon:yes gene_type:complete